MRYGIVGTGMMGIEHIMNVNALDGATVTALADPVPESLSGALAATEGPRPAAFVDHQQLVDADICDAVVVATPNYTHHRVLVDLLDTDLPVLVEKPLCTTVADCRDLVERASKRDALTWVGLEYRYMLPISVLIDHVHDGTVGDVKMVSIREHRFPFLPKVGDWNRTSEKTGGTLVEKCCHFFDLMELLTGSPAMTVNASGGQAVNRLTDGEIGPAGDMLDHAFVTLTHENGAVSLLDLCMFAEASMNQEEVSVVGDLGKIEAFIPDDVVRIGRRGKDSLGDVIVQEIGADSNIKYRGHHYGASFIEHQRFIAAIEGGHGPDVSVEDGMRSVVIGAAAHRSVEEGRTVEISELR